MPESLLTLGGNALGAVASNPLGPITGAIGGLGNFLTSAVGHGAFAGLDFAGKAGDTIKAPGLRGPKSLQLPTPDSLTAKEGATKMARPRNLKELLVQKIRQSKTASVRLPFTVSDNDLNLVDKLASVVQTSLMEKTAAGGYMGPIGDALVGPLQVAGMGYLGYKGLEAAYDTVSDTYKRNRAYHQMFKEFPQLAEVPREQVDKYWSVLMDYAPKMTINPLVAGQFVENMLNYGVKGIDHNTASQLMQAEAAGRNASGATDLSKIFGTLGGKNWDAAAMAS
jgi:hypothetical protein